MLAPRQRPLQLLSWVTLFIFLVMVYRSPEYIKHPEDIPRPNLEQRNHNQPSNQNPLQSHKAPDAAEEAIKHIEAPTNSTLGFGALVVVSKPNSPRRHSLIQAANVTEIDLTIPDQPVWTDQDFNNFRNGPDSKMGYGSVMAWLGHYNALKW
jgi:hypothetical protein